jgi:hypothetical protein
MGGIEIAGLAVGGVAVGTWLVRWLVQNVRAAYLPVLLTYFAYGASGVTSIAMTFFQKDALGLQPADAARIGFWLSLPWGMKMVVGVATDRYPLLGERRRPYLLAGAACSLLGYALLATTVTTAGTYLVAMMLVTAGFMVQDVVADALSVEVAADDHEVKQIQTLGRTFLLGGMITAGGKLGGWLAGALGPRPVFVLAMGLPVLVAVAAMFVRTRRTALAAPEDGPLGGANSRIILAAGLAYAAFGVALEVLAVPRAQEIVLVVSAGLIGFLLRRIGITRTVLVAALVIFLFRATPSAGQGYTYWAIDGLGFDQDFLGWLAQVGAVLSFVGLVVFRRTITERPVSFTLLWVTVAATVLYLPNIGLFYGLHERLGISARSLALIDATVSAPLAQLTMVPMLVLIARTAPRGAEATMFAVMASLMNLALSASELVTRYLNEWFAVTQQDYSRLGRLMLVVLAVNLLPLLALGSLRRAEAEMEAEPRTPAAHAVR